MKKRFILIPTLCIISLIAVLSACDSQQPETQTTETSTSVKTETTAPTVSVPDTNYTYNTEFFTVTEKTTFLHTPPPVPTRPADNNESDDETTVSSQKSTVSSSTTKKSDDTSIAEDSLNGISILSKTSPVYKGNTANIIIYGKPNKEYSIEFYTEDGKKADYEGLENVVADSSGIASWNFMIEKSVESGSKKIIIREKGSDNYAQTSIEII